jgi:hypothetical protein
MRLSDSFENPKSSQSPRTAVGRDAPVEDGSGLAGRRLSGGVSGTQRTGARVSK